MSFQAAIAAGADAVYVGGSSFGARAFADNFDEEQLLKAIDYAHFHGRKLFLTVNTLLKEAELEQRLYDYLLPYYEHGLDAVIVQDVGVLQFVRQHFPKLAIHASTQMTITNTLGAQFMKQQGVERVVPARELSLPEIRDMAEATGLEIECFVHGALCYCYSGQCLLSSMIGGRSGNRGQCAQPCRLPYEADGRRGYLLSPKDICTLDLIPDMIDAGIYSFKIEGRMKKPEYVAAVTSMYRKYVDLYLEHGRKRFYVEPEDKMMLMDIYNRGGFDDGYYKKHNGAQMMSIDRPNHAGVPAFQVISQKNREVNGKAIVTIRKGDILELTKEDNYTFGQNVPKGNTFSIIVPKKKYYQKGVVLSRIRNQSVLDRIGETYIEQLTTEKVEGTLDLKVGERSRLQLLMRGVSVTCEGDVVEAAKNQPLSSERIEKQLRKTGNTEFEWSNLIIHLEGDLFLPMQQLNELRRLGLQKLQDAICAQYRREVEHDVRAKDKYASDKEAMSANEKVECDNKQRDGMQTNERIGCSVLVETMEQLQIALKHDLICRIYIDCNIVPQILRTLEHFREYFSYAKEHQREVYFAMPHIFRADAVKEYEAYYGAFCELAMDGVLIRNYESYQFLKDHSYAGGIQLDSNLYVMNSSAKGFWEKEGISDWTTPVELSYTELSQLDLQQGEMIAYGHLPMMISAGCIKKTLGKCNHVPEKTFLKDRLNHKYPVKNYCDFCYNIMYNDEPLVLYDQMDIILDLNPKRVRLQFTVESAEEMEQMLSYYEEALAGSEMAEPDVPFTRGHFRRGIR